jgi:Galactose oxidase, central domain
LKPSFTLTQVTDFVRFGGTNGLQWFNDVWSYDPRLNLWVQLDCIGYIPAAREGHAAALVGDVMYIFGGRTEEGADLGDLAAFRISSRRWYTFQNMGPAPSPRSGHTMTACQQQIIVLGGEPSTPPRDPSELNLVYVLDTSKIRYPNDMPKGQQSQVVDRVAGNRRPSQGERSLSQQGRRAAGRDESGTPDQLENKRPSTAGRDSAAPGGVNIGNPFGGPREPPQVAPGAAPGSRLPQPRASVSQAPSGPPPQQQAPPPKVNGSSPVLAQGARVKTPTRNDRIGGPTVDTSARMLAQQNVTKDMSPVIRDSPLARQTSLSNVTNEIKMSPQQQSTGQFRNAEPTTNGVPGRNNSRGKRQQASLDSIDSAIARSQNTQPFVNNSTVRSESKHGIKASYDGGSLKSELDDAKRTLAWQSSELALARKAGYTPSTALNTGTKRGSIGEDDRPLMEALLAMRSELARIQEAMSSQSATAAQKVSAAEKQRDSAINEAVYAKAKLAAHGGSQTSTPQLGVSSRDMESGDVDRLPEMSRKLAAALAAQNELKAKYEALSSDLEAEKRAKSLAEDTASASQRRIADLDAYRQQSASEIESLKMELHEAEKGARDLSSKHAEATSDAQLLRVDKDEMSAKLGEHLEAAKSHQSSLESLRIALVASSDKASMLEQKLAEERAQHEDLDQQHTQLRSDHGQKTRELEGTHKKLREAEEIAVQHATEAKTHREAMLTGLGAITSRGLNGEGSAADERVRILRQQVDTANALAQQSKVAADTASEKLRRAEERIAGLESFQDQASRESVALRKQMQTAVKEAQALRAENTDLQQKYAAHQLDANAVAVQHSALKDLLSERGISPSDKRRSRTLGGSPTSGYGTPDISRLHDLEQQLEASHKAHNETKTTFETREQEQDKAYREKLELLETDYQSAVHYVKGTEKMLKHMKNELSKLKSQNARLQTELTDAQKAGSAERSAHGAPPEWETERSALKKEIEGLHQRVETSVAQLEQQMQEIQSELKSAEVQRDHYRQSNEQMEGKYAEIIHRSQADLDQLKGENSLLETRALDAEHKVGMLLNQMENSVDNYRRQSRALPEANGVAHTEPASNNRESMSTIGRDSMYGDNRTSVALDSLATELDALRSHWENTNKNYRLSNNFDFEKTPTSNEGGELSSSLAKWRQRLDMEEQDADDNSKYSHSGSKETTPTTQSTESLVSHDVTPQAQHV